MRDKKNIPTTRTLENEIAQVSDQASLDRFLKRVDASEKVSSFIAYFRSLDEVKAIPDAVLAKGSGIERTYCYHILNGSKVPGRDKIIRLCLAAGLDDTQTRRALEAGKEPAFYAKSRRDAVIRFALSRHLNVIDTNLLLNEYGEEPLD